MLVEQADNGVSITLTDGDEGNLLSIDDVGRLAGVVREADIDGSSWVLLRHAGRDLCLGRAPGKLGTPERSVLLELVQTLRTVNVPVITAASGGCAGFGAALLGLADIGLITDGAWLQFPEILRGSAPAIVATWLFDLVPYKTGFYWIATAEKIDAQTAVSHGLALRVVPDLDEAVSAELAKLGGLDREAIRKCKAITRVMRQMPGDGTARRDIALRWFD